MERYIIREPRMPDYPQRSMQNTNQMVSIPGGNNENIDPEMFLETPFRRNHNFTPTAYMPYTPSQNKQDFIQYSVPHKQEFSNIQMNPGYVPINCLPPDQRTAMSGIDRRYLAAYADPNAQFIASGQQMQRESTIPANAAFGGDYLNRMPERNPPKTFAPKETAQESTIVLEMPTPNKKPIPSPQPLVNTPVKKMELRDVNKSETPNQIMTRADKLKALHRSGARVFSGPVEKVLKWHKALQDIGVYVIYEIVAKCVNIRAGEPCAKNLVVRDENGPAMQIVYYEVDFLLPELKPPCTIRVIGRMMSGTSRFQAFNVRLATGDDVATLPRRAAVAAHHIAKICKEYSI